MKKKSREESSLLTVAFRAAKGSGLILQSERLFAPQSLRRMRRRGNRLVRRELMNLTSRNLTGVSRRKAPRKHLTHSAGGRLETEKNCHSQQTQRLSQETALFRNHTTARTVRRTVT